MCAVLVCCVTVRLASATRRPHQLQQIDTDSQLNSTQPELDRPDQRTSTHFRHRRRRRTRFRSAHNNCTRRRSDPLEMYTRHSSWSFEWACARNSCSSPSPRHPVSLASDKTCLHFSNCYNHECVALRERSRVFSGHEGDVALNLFKL